MNANYRVKGQGMIEYLILVCLVALASISIVSVVGQNLKTRYASISSALRGEKARTELEKPSAEHYKLRGFDDYDQDAIKANHR